MVDESIEERSPRRKKVVVVVAAISVLAILMFATSAIVSQPKEVKPVKGVTSTREVSNRSSNSTEPPPVIDGGVTSWNDLLAKLQSMDTEKGLYYLKRMQEMHPDMDLPYIASLAASETRGVNYGNLLPAGTPVTNSTRPNAQQIDFFQEDLKTDREVLVDDKGQPAVFKSCGNMMKLAPGKVAAKPKAKPAAKPKVKPKAKPKAKPKPKVSPQKPPINKYPNTTPHWPKNNSTQKPKANTEKACPTPGVVPGQPEEVAKQQEEDRDADGPTQVGQPGSDDADTRNPDGTHEQPPVPTTPPDTTSDDQHSGDPGAPN